MDPSLIDALAAAPPSILAIILCIWLIKIQQKRDELLRQMTEALNAAQLRIAESLATGQAATATAIRDLEGEIHAGHGAILATLMSVLTEVMGDKKAAVIRQGAESMLDASRRSNE